MSPLTISSTALANKNALTDDSVWHLLLKITIPGVGTPIRLARNNENVTWDSETWTAFPFELNDISEESKGEVPQVELRVGNVSRAMEAYLQAYDLYLKTSGFSPIVVNIYVVNSENLGSATPEVEHQFELIAPKTNSMWATFTLGAANPFNQRYPQFRLLKSHCRYVFKGTLCGYTGSSATTCNKTITKCRALDSGTSTSVGSGFLADTAKSWSASEWVGRSLVDSLGIIFYIVSHTADTLTVTGGAADTPTAGAYTLSNSKRFGGFLGVGAGGLRLA